jgi:hypothetical protein
MRVRLDAIRVRRDTFNSSRMRGKIRDARRRAANDAKGDFQKTTVTWETSVSFVVREQGEATVVSTTNPIYVMVNFGTRPHLIAARGKMLRFMAGSSPKTQPGVIGSSAGAAGAALTYKRIVMHPGTAPRLFDKAIARWWRPEFKRRMRAALRSA